MSPSQQQGVMPGEETSITYAKSNLKRLEQKRNKLKDKVQNSLTITTLLIICCLAHCDYSISFLPNQNYKVFTLFTSATFHFYYYFDLYQVAGIWELRFHTRLCC